MEVRRLRHSPAICLSNLLTSQSSRASQKKKKKKARPLWQPIYIFFFPKDSLVETDLFKSLFQPNSSSLPSAPQRSEEDCFLKPHCIIFKSFFFLSSSLLSSHPPGQRNGHSTCPASHLQRVIRSVIFSKPRIHVSTSQVA